MTPTHAQQGRCLSCNGPSNHAYVSAGGRAACARMPEAHELGNIQHDPLQAAFGCATATGFRSPSSTQPTQR